jgi:hypothetical protein
MTKCGGHTLTRWHPPKVHWGVLSSTLLWGSGDLRLQYNLFVVKYNFACRQIQFFDNTIFLFQNAILFLVIKQFFDNTICLLSWVWGTWDYNTICLLSNTSLFVVKYNFLKIQFSCFQIQFIFWSSNTIFWQYNILVVKYNFGCRQIQFIDNTIFLFSNTIFFLVVKHNFLTIQFACFQIQLFFLSSNIIFWQCNLLVVKYNFVCRQTQFFDHIICLSSNTIFFSKHKNILWIYKKVLLTAYS